MVINQTSVKTDSTVSTYGLGERSMFVASTPAQGIETNSVIISSNRYGETHPEFGTRVVVVLVPVDGLFHHVRDGI